MIYETPEIADFFKGKIIEEPSDLPKAELTTKSIEEQRQEVLEGLKKLPQESIDKVIKWIENQ